MTHCGRAVSGVVSPTFTISSKTPYNPTKTNRLYSKTTLLTPEAMEDIAPEYDVVVLGTGMSKAKKVARCAHLADRPDRFD